jgi:hypothetical protein
MVFSKGRPGRKKNPRLRSKSNYRVWWGRTHLSLTSRTTNEEVDPRYLNAQLNQLTDIYPTLPSLRYTPFCQETFYPLYILNKLGLLHSMISH